MITRYAMFEGSLKPGSDDAFRAAVEARLVPLWRQFPGATEVRVMFSTEADEGAPSFPMILAITYGDRAGMASALDSPFRAQSRDVTGEIVAEFFEGRIHHHVTEMTSYAPA